MSDTYNLAAYIPEDYLPDTKQLCPVFPSVPSANFGASKLVARYLQLLLTAKGSDRTDPVAGCHLLEMLHKIHTSEQAYVRNAVNDILEDVNEQMLGENDPGAPAEARFSSASCDAVEVEADCIRLHFTIVSETNQLLEFQLPVSNYQ